MKYLVDTNKIIDFLKGKEEVIDELGNLFDEGFGISVITTAEMIRGAYLSSRPRENVDKFKRFLSENEIPVIEIDHEIAEIYGENDARLMKAGNEIPGFDMLIAATCLKYGLKLVTGDYRHFSRVEGLEIKN